MKYLFKIILGLILISSCQSKKGEHDQKEQNANTFYTCSMDPQVKEDKPGKCPICHMDLTPMKAVSATKDEIELSDQQIKLGSIHTVLLAESNNILNEKFTGVLAINQEKTNSIASRVMGRIEKLYVKAVGDYIQVNSPVYEIYSEDLAILKRDYLLAIKQSKIEGNFKNTAEAMKEAARQKMLLFGLSESLIEKIAASNDQSQNVTFLSPYSGYVTELNFSEGGYVMEGASIMQLAPLNSLWVEAQINVNYIGKISLDQTSKITFPDFPSKTYTGKITFINPEVNPNTRLVLIRVEVNNRYCRNKST
jgi:Cu(I)/Ag(I) efflux system membrane fusion protein